VNDLHVEPTGPGRYRVGGRTGTYDVEITGDVARCSCWGARRWHHCRHLAAVWEYLRVTPVAAAPVGPAFDDAPPPEPPADLDVDALALEAGPFGDAPAAPPATPPADPLAAVVEKWERKRTKRGRSEQAA